MSENVRCDRKWERFGKRNVSGINRRRSRRSRCRGSFSRVPRRICSRRNGKWRVNETRVGELVRAGDGRVSESDGPDLQKRRRRRRAEQPRAPGKRATLLYTNVPLVGANGRAGSEGNVVQTNVTCIYIYTTNKQRTRETFSATGNVYCPCTCRSK